MLGVLVVRFGSNTIARRRRFARQHLILLEDLVGVATNPDFGPVAVIGLVALWLATLVTAASAAATMIATTTTAATTATRPPLLVVRSHLSLVNFVAVSRLCYAWRAAHGCSGMSSSNILWIEWPISPKDSGPGPQAQ